MTLDAEDINAIAEAVSNRIKTGEKSVWVEAGEAMRLLGCGSTTLYRLRKSNSIRHNGSGIKGAPIKYMKQSILNHLAKPNNQIK